MAFKSLFEPAEDEVARLAQAPEGSTNHSLSKLPVTIRHWPQDLLIELPWAAIERSPHRIVVVPIQYHKESGSEEREQGQPIRRHAGSWDCVVVYSEHPSYPVGGYHLSISAAEIARGTKVAIEGTTPREA